MSKQYKFLVILPLLLILYPGYSKNCNPEKYPYFLQLSNSCGASLLTPKFGLTSGYCCKTVGDLKATSGYRKNKNYEEFDQQRRVVQRVTHPDHSNSVKGTNKYKFQNDYCLLKFKEGFAMNKRTSMVALATKKETEQLFKEMPIIEFFGCGGNIFRTVNNKTILEIPEVKFRKYLCVNGSIPSQETCSEVTTNSGISFDSEKQLCIFDKNSENKLSDGINIGSPAVYKNLQFGIVSFKSSARDIIVLARVDLAYDWIDNYKMIHRTLRHLENSPSLASFTKGNFIVSILLLLMYVCFVAFIKQN